MDTPNSSQFSAPHPPVAAPPENETSTPKIPLSLADWESLIGGKWALWIGSLCLFLAISSFMPRTWAIVPPWAKIAMGMASGFALVLAGGLARGRTQRYFSEGLSGAGLSICYLSLWAGGQYFSVFSSTESFVGMTLLTALGVGLAVRYDALSLSILSTLGGFLTPVLLRSSGGNAHAGPLLTYVLLLDAGILAVSLRKEWRSLVWLSFVCSTFLVGNWWLNADIGPIHLLTFLYFTGYFLLFAGSSTFYSLFHGEETKPQDLLLLFGSTSIYAVMGHEVAKPLLSGLPGAFPLGLAVFFGVANLLVKCLAPENQALKNSAGGLAITGLTLAIPLQFHQSGLTCGWAVEAAVLLVLSGRQASPLLRRAGQVLWALTSMPLALDLAAPTSSHFGIFSAAALPLVVYSLATTVIAWNARVRASDSADRDPMESLYTWSAASGFAWLMGLEIYHYFQLHHVTSFHLWGQQAAFAISAALGIYALATYSLGLRWKNETMRLHALVITVVTQTATLGLTFATGSPLEGPIWNYRSLAFLLLSLSSITIGRFLATQNENISANEKSLADVWAVMSAGFLVAGATFEIYFRFSHGHSYLSSGLLCAAAFAVAMLWSLAGASFYQLGIAWRQTALRAMGLTTVGGGIALLLLTALSTYLPRLPFLNWRGVAFGASLIALQWICRLIKQDSEKVSQAEESLLVPLTFTTIFLLLWVLTQESYELAHFAHHQLGSHWELWGKMAVSLVWSAFGTVLLVRGIAKSYQPFRLSALGLLSLTILKVFLVDLAFLEGPSRVFCLAGLGLSLIFISWIYNRFGSDKTTGDRSALAG